MSLTEFYTFLFAVLLAFLSKPLLGGGGVGGHYLTASLLRPHNHTSVTNFGRWRTSAWKHGTPSTSVAAKREEPTWLSCHPPLPWGIRFQQKKRVSLFSSRGTPSFYLDITNRPGEERDIWRVRNNGGGGMGRFLDFLHCSSWRVPTNGMLELAFFSRKTKKAVALALIV